MRVAVVTFCAAVLAATAPASAGTPLLQWPAAGELVVPQVFARRAPDRHAPVVRVLGQFRSDFRPRVVLALESRIASGGSRWYRLSLPGRPNGGRGWVPADAVRVRPVANKIVVEREARRLEVRRVGDGKLLFRAPIAVGAPNAPTPLGRNFYVQWRFAPTDPFYGPFALETSAYSRISDWPGGGVVGIHGTSLPQLIGGAVSHGCIRMRNEDVVRLRRLAPVGTAIDVMR